MPISKSASWLRWPVASLRTYLIAVILVATVPLGALTSYLIAQEMSSSREQLYSGLQRTAASVAQTVERELISSIDALRILTYSYAIQEGDLQRFHHTLEQLSKVRPTWSRVFLTDLEGRVLLSTVAPFSTEAAAPASPSDRVSVDTVVRTRQPRVTGLESTGPGGSLVTRIEVPVLVGEQVRYILVAQITSQTWQQLVGNTAAPPNGYVSVFDASNRLIARSLHADRYVGRLLPVDAQRAMGHKLYGAVKTRMMEGSLSYVAWQRIGPWNWGVGIGVSAEPMDQAQTNALSMAVVAGAISLLSGLALSLTVARRVSDPLAALAEQGAGATSEPITVREIAALRDALLEAQQQRELSYERLQAKAAEFETLFNTSPIGLSISQDPQCRSVLRNPAKVAMFNLGSSSQTAYRVFHQGRELPPAEQPLARASRGEVVSNLELEVHHHDGRVIELLANAVPLLDTQGRPRGGIAAFVDITERMQAQERLVSTERRLRESQHLVELAQEAGDVGFFDYLFTADKVTATSGLAKLFGVPADEFDGPWAHWTTLVNPEHVPMINTVLQDALRERQEQITFKFQTLGAHAPMRWLSSRMVVMYEPDGKPLRLIGVMVDVTAQQLIEQERARFIAQEQAARVQAENANRAKDEFLAMLGHELRNPLGAISAAVEVLNRISSQDDPAVRARQIITRQTRHLARLMDDLLDVARVITGKILLSRQPVNMGAAVQRLVSTMTMASLTHQHEVTVEADDVWVQADAVRLEQVVNNLLTNAIKYTPAGGKVHVSVRRQGPWAELVVRDTGMGIPPALLPRVFDLFVQGERTLDRRQGGLGIGLTLVRRLVELHDGQVSAASDGQGSVFTVQLPAIAPPVEDDVPAHPAHQAGHRVLVVEDNEDAMEALRFMLELKGHKVWSESTGTSGLERLLEVQPDVALVDIGLPGLTGFEVAQQARARGFKGQLLALSGYGQFRDVQRALDSGFNAHLVKPIDPDVLDEHLGSLP